jgi:23S rRNA (uracil1939-C5)-methyltransferase
MLTENNLQPDVSIEFISAGEHSLRHKADFVYQYKDNKSQFGFYTKSRELLDIEVCLQMSAPLQKTFQIFRSIEIKTKDYYVKKGSVRLRISPENEMGCWLDFSNFDIKNLLEDQTYLKELLKNNRNRSKEETSGS